MDIPASLDCVSGTLLKAKKSSRGQEQDTHLGQDSPTTHSMPFTSIPLAPLA